MSEALILISMARKLVVIFFEFLALTPPKNRVCKTFFAKHEKIKVVQNDEKIGRKIEYVKRFLLNMKKIKIVKIQSY